MSGTHDPQTLRYYSENAAPYLASRPTAESRNIRNFMNALPPGGRVLELGCGSGRDTEVFRKSGFDVVPTDGCDEIAVLAEQRLGSPVSVMRFDQLDAFDEFDGVWANASLHHVPREGLPHVLTLIHRALKRGGVHYANYKAGGKDGRDERARYYSYLSMAQMMAAYQESGAWEVLEQFAYDSDKRYETTVGSWVGVMARKTG